MANRARRIHYGRHVPVGDVDGSSFRGCFPVSCILHLWRVLSSLAVSTTFCSKHPQDCKRLGTQDYPLHVGHRPWHTWPHIGHPCGI